jgi:hypothetical protein
MFWNAKSMLYLTIILHFWEIPQKLVLTVAKKVFISLKAFDADLLSNILIVIK